MTSFWKLCFLAAAAVCCVASASAQITYTAGPVTFKNPAGFSQQQLEDAAGMHTGTSFVATDLTAAAQKLSDTGYFDTVGASLEGPVKKVNVIFDLKPLTNAQLLHAGFENFVLLSRAEIDALVKAAVPLYNGYLPEVTSQNDALDTALEQALAAKGMQAKVGHDTFETTLRHPERVIDFFVERPAIRVANVKLSGVSAEVVPYVQKSVNGVAKTSYNEGLAKDSTTGLILEPLLDAGYAEATLATSAPEATVAADGSVEVVVTGTLHAGEVYHVGQISFAGSPLISAAAFAETQKLHAGDVASQKALRLTLDPLDSAYRRRGYMDVLTLATPKFHEETHTVDYAVTVEPGEVYTVRNITLGPLAAAARAEFDGAFTMKTGDVYNPEYLRGFSSSHPNLRAFSAYSMGYKAYADPNAHTVDVVLSFYRGR